MADMTRPRLISRAGTCSARTALVGADGTATYGELLDRSAAAAAVLLDGRADLGEARIVFLVPPGVGYAVAQWAIWRAGGVAVPLSSSQAPAEWDFIVDDAQASIVVGEDEPGTLRSIAAAHGARFIEAGALVGGGGRASALPDVADRRLAMILYTSGTTSRPKGVATTHGNLEAQISSLTDAWGWSEDDRILHVLPLNHVHGIVNVLGCALWSGAVCEFLWPFDAAAVWRRLEGGRLTLFMAVPTIYAKLLVVWDAAPMEVRAAWSAAASRLRLMVSGSAALPVPLLERWRAVTGHVLLERYGMTEIGMALSNPLAGARRPGFVGQPLPGVEIRLVDQTGREVVEGTPGEIEVRGAGVFREYWRRPEATREAFRGGWFRTGDLAVCEEGSYRILGRMSVDIIKTGGYKVSALEIEDVLRLHPGVRDCAVVGVPDDEWGERVAAAIVASEDAKPTLEDVREWAALRLAGYKLPTRLREVEDLPRNAMGKVVKARVKELF
jgi:malonyl-CoA/methylmalonyl-CoA synthetase